MSNKEIEEEVDRTLEAGRKIVKRRLELGLSRAQFAGLLRISEDQLYDLECGAFWQSEEDNERWINETLGD